MPIKRKLKKIKKLPPSKLKPKGPHAPAMETKPRPTKSKIKSDKASERTKLRRRKAAEKISEASGSEKPWVKMGEEDKKYKELKREYDKLNMIYSWEGPTRIFVHGTEADAVRVAGRLRKAFPETQFNIFKGIG